MKDIQADITIIGAGAAGLMAAKACYHPELSIYLLEHNPHAGKKILISGGGRCNFTNLHSGPRDFYSSNPHFCKSALASFSPQDFIQLVEAENIAYYEKKLGQLFCRNSARDILDLLLKNIDRPNIQIEYNQKNLKIKKVEGRFQITSDNLTIHSKKLVIATGGLSMPKLGATNFGYRVAESFGHQIVPTQAALVPLDISDFKELSGVSLEAQVKIDKYKVTEDVLFTHHGLSGPAILKASLYWEPSKLVSIDWLPHQKLKQYIESIPQNEKIFKSLKSFFPHRFAQYILDACQITDNTQWANLSKKQLHTLEQFIHHFQFTPSSTQGFRKAEVTKGGVSTKDVSSKTMESQLTPGMYFIGEVLDVTGQLGGHNFQWAWASAMACGRAILKSLELETE